MQVNRTDVAWNYAATFLKIASTSLLLPFILKKMPAETVGIWSVFVAINSLNGLFDFGFSPAFTRNITYIFSGVNKLEIEGFSTIDNPENVTINYTLLKGMIRAMKFFYARTAFLFFMFLATVGTYYIYTLLKNYQSSHSEVFIAWALLCTINAFNLFTFYYDSLLQGKGLIKTSKQIVIVGQILYMVIAILLIIANYGLVAIVLSQAVSVIVVRWLSHRILFNTEFNELIKNAGSDQNVDIFKIVWPNAAKIGLTTVGGILVQRSALIIGSLYLSLDQIASYGISMQIIGIISGLATIYISTYQVKIVQLRVLKDQRAIAVIYKKSQLIFLLTFFIGGTCLLTMGGWLLKLIGSSTQLMPIGLLILALLLSLEQTNIIICSLVLMTKNTIPFFKASLISGIAIIVGLLITFHSFNLGLFTLLLIPLLVDFCYQGWKWQMEVLKDLGFR